MLFFSSQIGALIQLPVQPGGRCAGTAAATAARGRRQQAESGRVSCSRDGNLPMEAGGSSSWQGGAVFCPDSYRPAQRVSLWHVPVFPALRRVAVGRFAKAPLFYSSLIFGAAWLTASFHPWRWRLLGRRSSPRSRSAQTPASLCSAEPFRKGKHFFSPLCRLCLFGLGRRQRPLSSRVGPKGGVRSRQPRWLQRSPALSAAPGPREPRGRGTQRRAHRNKPHRSDKSSVWCT